MHCPYYTIFGRTYLAANTFHPPYDSIAPYLPGNPFIHMLFLCSVGAAAENQTTCSDKNSCQTWEALTS